MRRNIFIISAFLLLVAAGFAAYVFIPSIQQEFVVDNAPISAPSIETKKESLEPQAATIPEQPIEVAENNLPPVEAALSSSSPTTLPLVSEPVPEYTLNTDAPTEEAQQPENPISREVASVDPINSPAIETQAPSENLIANSTVPETPVVENDATPETNAPNETPEYEEVLPELNFQVDLGYGFSYMGLDQSGSFGSINGSAIVSNAFEIQTKVSYEKWSLGIGFEKASANFSSDTTNATQRESKDFKTFSIKPGYGVFFAGIKADTTPLMRASGTVLNWSDATVVSGVLGVRLEKEFTQHRKKPFLVGVEAEASHPFSASGDGGPQISSTGGFGINLKGFAEKAISVKENYTLKIGLEGMAGYQKNDLSGSWSGSAGDISSTTQKFGAKLYLGVQF